MEILYLLVKACLIGFCIAVPLGPVGVFCINKTLELGFFRGAVTVGLGIAIADSICGAIAITALEIIMLKMREHESILKFISGVFFLGLAIQEIVKKTKKSEVIHSRRKAFVKLVIKSLVLTSISPLTIMSFIGVFAALNMTNLSIIECLVTSIGLSIGSFVWWLILGWIIVTLKKYMSDRLISCTRYLSSGILLTFGLFALYNSIYS